ncbi:MAG: hypothetical protein RL318_298 [Fibrobacterota bacterium]|jgi:hypothetical protein
MSGPALVAVDFRLTEAERCERLCEIFKNVEMPDMRARLLAPLAELVNGNEREGELAARTLFFVGTTWQNHVRRVATLPHLRRMLLRRAHGMECLPKSIEALDQAAQIDLDSVRRDLQEGLESGIFPASAAPVFALEAVALRERSRALADAADPYSMRTMARLLPRLRLYDELADRLDLLSREASTLAVPDLGLLKFLGDKEYDKFCRTFHELPGGAFLGKALELQRRFQFDPPQLSALFTISRSLGLPAPGANWTSQLDFWLSQSAAGMPVRLPVASGPALKLLEHAGVRLMAGGIEVSPGSLDLAGLLDADTLSMSLALGKKPHPPDWKGLVMSNITRETLLVSFLQNPKVVRIPGLVESIVVNCRSGQVLSIIAQKRDLHTGHQNKGVPAALLRSRTKVPMTLLRRFIHLRFVSRAELKDLALRASRPEVAKEVADYLASI